jgi:predicted lipoprotein with Yx(FWY)xxD motif
LTGYGKVGRIWDKVRKIFTPLIFVQSVMHWTRRALLGSAAAAVTVAGCFEGDGDSGTRETEPEANGTETPTTEPTTEGMDGDERPTVQLRPHPDHGEILVGPEELTLYMFDQDTRGDGASACYDGCAESWPPLTVTGTPTAGDQVTADVETFERDTGETQVVAGGWPLYYFAGDDEPGDAAGQGVNDVWWVLTPAGEPVKPAEETESPSGGRY